MITTWLESGNYARYAKGKVAIFGEAAMFNAQLAVPNRTPRGMNSAQAKQVYRFLLKLMHWLTHTSGTPNL